MRKKYIIMNTVWLSC